MENSFALALIILVAALPWRPGAEPAFYAEPGRAALTASSRRPAPAARTARPATATGAGATPAASSARPEAVTGAGPATATGGGGQSAGRPADVRGS